MYRQRYQWNVMCDCYGHFKPIQCHKDICVCVNKMGDQEGDPVTFTGSDEL